MPALKNNSAVTHKRAPQYSQRQGMKSNGGSDAAVALPSSAAQLSKSHRSSLRSGNRYGRAAVSQKATKKAAGNGNRVSAGGRASESCAWPAYARGAAEAETEALAAVRSLYADELKPFGRILRKRIAEQILQGRGIACTPTSDALPEVDGKQVRAVCEGCKLLRVEEEEGGDWSTVFVDYPSTFVDVYSPVDCYYPQLWSGLQAYCEGPLGEKLLLPGGRYACAQSLQALQLPLLAGFSLGRICHIVQLAISQKRVLGYMNGAVVPYVKSQSSMKEQCAMHGQPTVGKSNGQNNVSPLPIASLEVARKHVLEILDAANGEAPLSNIKRLFRSRFQIELSETSFGYSKLSELLQGPSFSDICSVELRGHGYTVIKTDATINGMANQGTGSGFPAALLEDGPRRVPLCADEPLSFDDMDALSKSTPMVLVATPTPTPGRPPAPRRWCLSPSKNIGGDCFIDYSVQHTFLQYKVPQTPLPGPKRRSHSLPKDMGRSTYLLDSETCSVDNELSSTCKHRSSSKLSHESESTTDTSCSESSHKLSSRKRTDSGSSAELSSDEESFGYLPQLPEIFWGRTPGTTPLPPPAPQTSMPNATASHASTQFITALESLCGSSLCTMEAGGDMAFVAPEDSESERKRVTFCPDEPLGFDDTECFVASPKASKPSPFTTLSPAVVPPTPSPLPLYNYSQTASWQRQLPCPPPPQAPPTVSLAMAPSNTHLGCLVGFPMAPPAQSESVCSTALSVPQHGLYPGCVIRLGEHL